MRKFIAIAISSKLESLGPLTKLAPGKSVAFIETWRLFDSLEQDFLSDKIIEVTHDRTSPG